MTCTSPRGTTSNLAWTPHYKISNNFRLGPTKLCCCDPLQRARKQLWFEYLHLPVSMCLFAAKSLPTHQDGWVEEQTCLKHARCWDSSFALEEGLSQDASLRCKARSLLFPRAHADPALDVFLLITFLSAGAG